MDPYIITDEAIHDMANVFSPSRLLDIQRAEDYVEHALNV